MSTSHAKYEEIHQNLVNTQSKAEEAVSLKEQEMKEILVNTEKQLTTEKSLVEERLTELKSEFTKLKVTITSSMYLIHFGDWQNMIIIIHVRVIQ